jgi:exonuclease SbcD
VFEGFSYTALGHLHRPQTVRGSETIRYSGTPLPYSFSETGPKSVVMVDMDSGGCCDVSLIDVPVGRKVRTVAGSFGDLVNGKVDEDHLVRVDLADATPVRDAKRRLESVFPFLIELRQRSMQTSLRSAGAGTDVESQSLARQVEDFLRTATQDEPDIGQFNLIVEALADAGANVGDLTAVRSDLIDQVVAQPESAPAGEQSTLDLWGSEGEGVA